MQTTATIATGLREAIASPTTLDRIGGIETALGRLSARVERIADQDNDAIVDERRAREVLAEDLHATDKRIDTIVARLGRALGDIDTRLLALEAKPTRPTLELAPAPAPAARPATLRDVVLEIMTGAGRPMTAAEIIGTPGYQSRAPGSCTSTLSALVKAGEVNRVGAGLYAVPGVNFDPLTQGTHRARVLAALAAMGGRGAAYRVAEMTGLSHIKACHALGRLTDIGVTRRLVRGFYELTTTEGNDNA